MKRNLISAIIALAISPAPFTQHTNAQINLSLGTNYTQNFDVLASSSSGDTNWTDNSTLPGWYASQRSGGSITGYRVSTGSSTTSSLYSFGANADSDRALGSLAGGTPVDFAYGVRFTNDTANATTNVTITYTGEQWRRLTGVGTQAMTFSYAVAGSAITNADARGTNYAWAVFTALDFNSPNVLGSTSALDGNNATNRQVFSSVVLPGVLVLPGQEIFLRWRDVDDSGSDHGLAIDDLSVTFTPTSVETNPPAISTQPLSRTNNAGTAASFTVAANGTQPLAYQWQKNGTNLVDGGNAAGATTASLGLSNVKHNDEGTYSCVVTNVAGSTNSAGATLTVVDPVISTHPTGSTNLVGERQTFSVAAAGTGTLHYQWCKNGADIAGATGSSLTVSNVAVSDAADYIVVVTNALGIVTSSVAILTLIGTPPVEIARWDFNSDPPDASTSTGVTTPTTGVGTVTLVGGATETFSSGAAQDPASLGNDNSGWNTSDYPSAMTNNKTAGVQFSFSTASYKDILLTWQQRHTSTASRYARVQYSTDGVNFTDFDVIAITNTDFHRVLADLSSIPAVNDNPDFAFRVVTEFESTATGSGNPNYVASGLASSYSGSGGTIRFDWVNIFANATSLVTPIPLHVQRSGDDVVLSWDNPAFSLQAAPAVAGDYTNLTGAASPYTNPTTGSPQYFRLKH